MNVSISVIGIKILVIPLASSIADSGIIIFGVIMGSVKTHLVVVKGKLNLQDNIILETEAMLSLVIRSI